MKMPTRMLKKMPKNILKTRILKTISGTRNGGSSLISVLCVFSFLLVMGTALLTASVSSQASSNAQINGDQAYFTARSAVAASMKTVLNTLNSGGNINWLTSSSQQYGSGSIPDMGTYRVYVRYIDDSGSVVYSPSREIKIWANAEYNKQQRTVSAYLKFVPAPQSSSAAPGNSSAASPSAQGASSGSQSTQGGSAGPFDFILCASGSIQDSFNAQVTGDVYVNSLFNMASGSTISGTIFAKNGISASGGIAAGGITSLGPVTITGGGNIQNLVYSTGDVCINGGSLIANGGVKTQGKATIWGGAVVNGDIDGLGNINVGIDQNGKNSSGTVTGNIRSNSSFAMGSATVNGDVACNISYSQSNGTLNGNVTSNGNITFSGGTVKQNVTAGQNADVTGWGKISGWLKYLQKLVYSNGSWDNIGNHVSGGAQQMSAYSPLDLSTAVPSPESVSFPTVNFNSYSSAASSAVSSAVSALTANATISDNTISSSGLLADSMFSSVDYGSTIIIDTHSASGGIALLVKNSAFTMASKGLKFLIRGSNPVYLYLSGSASFQLGANSFVEMENSSANPAFYVVGDGSSGQNVTLTNNSRLDGYVYLPNGCFTASGSDIDGYKLRGSVIAKTISVTSNDDFAYIQPGLSQTIFGSVSNSASTSEASPGAASGSSGTGSQSSGGSSQGGGSAVTGTWGLLKWAKS